MSSMEKSHSRWATTFDLNDSMKYPSSSLNDKCMRIDTIDGIFNDMHDFFIGTNSPLESVLLNWPKIGAQAQEMVDIEAWMEMKPLLRKSMRWSMWC